MLILKPSLKLIGAKTRIRERLYPYFPKHLNYFECFLGTGGILIGKPKSKIEIVSDLNPQIINYYQVMQTQSDNFWQGIQRTLKSIESLDEKHWKECFLQWRDYLTMDVLTANDLTKLNQAVCAYFVNKTCFNGILRFNAKGYCNSSFGQTFKGRGFFTRDWFYQVVDRVKDVTFECCDFTNIIYKFQQKSFSFLFADPPYRECQTTYNGISFSDSDHTNLADQLKGSNGGQWLLTINDDPFIRNLYKDCYIVENKVHYSCSQTPAGRGKKPELLIANYNLLQQLDKSRILVTHE